MLSNLHTHSTFSDGKNTPLEIVLYAIENGFCSIGFSDHSYTEFDLRYCMKDENGYIAEVNRLKKKYQEKIQIYLGIEEDIFSSVNRKNYDYIIASSHYLCVGGKYYPVDSNYELFKKCLKAFDNDITKMAKAYYETLCEKISSKKPDIIGHFDLITKFDEVDVPLFSCNEGYLKLADAYITRLIDEDIIFEVNTGAIARGIKSVPYPHERLLHTIKKRGGRITLSSDSHQKETLSFDFKETKNMLKNIGFEHVYTLYNGSFKKDSI